MTGTKITVKKSDNYTVMCNYHLRDLRLSNKTVGLLSKLLSLPPAWDYSIAGLTRICRDGKNSIQTSLDELEEFHYLRREQVRDKKGHFMYVLYTIYEKPFDAAPDAMLPLYPRESTASSEAGSADPSLTPRTVSPFSENRDTENPYAGNRYTGNRKTVNRDTEEPDTDSPYMAAPYAGDPPQLSKDIQSIDKLSKDTVSTKGESIKGNKGDAVTAEQTEAVPYFIGTEKERSLSGLHGKNRKTASLSSVPSFDAALLELHRRVSYDAMRRLNARQEAKLQAGNISQEMFDLVHADMDLADRVLSVLAGFVSQKNRPKTLSVAGEERAAEDVIRSFGVLDWGRLREVMNAYELNASRIRISPEGYILTIAAEKCMQWEEHDRIMKELNGEESEEEAYGRA